MFQIECGFSTALKQLFVSLFLLSQCLLSHQSACFSCCVSNKQDELDYEQTVLAVNQAARQFQEHVDFSCEFAYRKSEFKSWDDAWGSLSDPFAVYPAKLSKRSRDICLDLGETVDHRNVRLLTIDGISFSVQGSDGGFSLLPPPDVDKGLLTLQYNDPLLFSPLFYGGAHKGVLVAPLMENMPENIDTNNSVIRLGDGKFIVRQELSTAISKASIINKQEFHVLSGTPTKVREEYQEFGEDGKIRLRSVTEMEGFELCGSVPMATSLKRVLGPVGGKFITWKWQSNSLREPSEQDFMIEVPENVELPAELELGDSRTVDAARLREWGKLMVGNQKQFDNSDQNKVSTIIPSVPALIGTRLGVLSLAMVIFLSMLIAFSIRYWYLRNHRRLKMG